MRYTLQELKDGLNRLIQMEKPRLDRINATAKPSAEDDRWRDEEGNHIDQTFLLDKMELYPDRELNVSDRRVLKELESQIEGLVELSEGDTGDDQIVVDPTEDMAMADQTLKQSTPFQPCNPAPVYYPTLEDLADLPQYTSDHFPLFRKSGIVHLVLPPTATKPPIEQVLNKGTMKARSGSLTRSAQKQVVLNILPHNDGFRFHQVSARHTTLRPFELFTKNGQENKNESDDSSYRYPIAKEFSTVKEFAAAAALDELWTRGTSENTFDEEIVAEEEDRFSRLIGDNSIRRHYDVEREVSFYDTKQLDVQNRSVPDLGNVGDPLYHLGKHDPPDCPFEAAGINTTMAYLASRNTFFGIHQEDLELCSMNISLFGAPKIWYSIGIEDVPKFKAVLSKSFPEEASKCDQFLRHKEHWIKPQVLVDNGITVYRAVQYPNEIILTMPGGFHWGLNTGYAYNEAVNYMMPEWEEYGYQATICECMPEKVQSWKHLARGFSEVLGVELPNLRKPGLSTAIHT